jgi:hypothetical protein
VTSASVRKLLFAPTHIGQHGRPFKRVLSLGRSVRLSWTFFLQPICNCGVGAVCRFTLINLEKSAKGTLAPVSSSNSRGDRIYIDGQTCIVRSWRSICRALCSASRPSLPRLRAVQPAQLPLRTLRAHLLQRPNRCTSRTLIRSTTRASLN